MQVLALIRLFISLFIHLKNNKFFGPRYLRNGMIYILDIWYLDHFKVEIDIRNFWCGLNPPFSFYKENCVMLVPIYFMMHSYHFSQFRPRMIYPILSHPLFRTLIPKGSLSNPFFLIPFRDTPSTLYRYIAFHLVL